MCTVHTVPDHCKHIRLSLYVLYKMRVYNSYAVSLHNGSSTQASHYTLVVALQKVIALVFCVYYQLSPSALRHS